MWYENRHTREQMTHWDMSNKENSNLVAFFNMSQCAIFEPRDCSAAKGPFTGICTYGSSKTLNEASIIVI